MEKSNFKSKNYLLELIKRSLKIHQKICHMIVLYILSNEKVPSWMFERVLDKPLTSIVNLEFSCGGMKDNYKITSQL